MLESGRFPYSSNIGAIGGKLYVRKKVLFITPFIGSYKILVSTQGANFSIENFVNFSWKNVSLIVREYNILRIEMMKRGDKRFSMLLL